MEDALKADGFDDAIIGYGTHFSAPVVIYNYNRCVEILIARDGMSADDAVEYMEFNVCCVWMGLNTPVFMRDNLED